MPLSKKGAKILEQMRETYGSEKKAKQVFYSSINAGKIKGAERPYPGGRRPVHHSPYHGKVTGRHNSEEGNGGDRAQADTLKQEVAGGLRSMRGLQARRAQLASSRQDAAPAQEATASMRGALGSLRARGDVSRGEAAVHRQERFTSGRPLYDRRGRFIGNRKPD